MRSDTVSALADRLAAFDRVVEIGIGSRPDVAVELATRGVSVTATDVRRIDTPESVRFVRDDVTAPDRAVYADSDVLYALNLPPELHRPTRDLARSVDAAFCFTTLGGEQPVVPVERETLPGETLFIADPERP